MTVGEWLRMAQSRLRSAGISEGRLEAEVIAAHVLLVDRSWLLAHPESDFPDLAGEALLQRRERREPLAYILGFREFYGRRFRVSPAVLVPRQETETALELALDLGDAIGSAVAVLDLGCGSGCIGVTLKLERPSWSVVLGDVSPQAIGVAMHNAEALNADVRLVQADLCGGMTDEAFDLIVSNPPYVDPREALMPELAHEPPEALFAGEAGLDTYRRIASAAGRCLRTGGVIVLEIGHSQASQVRELFQAQRWQFVEARRDLIGHERALAFRNEKGGGG